MRKYNIGVFVGCILFSFLLLSCSDNSSVSEPDTSKEAIVPNSDDLYSDTWVGSDALGREMPTSEDVGVVKKDKTRTVGMFYVTWHTQSNYNDASPYKSVTDIYNIDPSAKSNATNSLWNNSYYHWGEPENGYFLSTDPYVIRKDISMLTDAGVDVLILDVTNSVFYFDEWNALFQTLEMMKAEGSTVPKFCFWSWNGDPIYVDQTLYEKYYNTGLYKDLWYVVDGKPLLLTNLSSSKWSNILNLSDYTDEVKSFFTFRNMWWGYYSLNGKRFVGMNNNWSFGYDLGDASVAVMSPRQLASKHNGQLEEMAVTPAQHASTMIGKSWRRETGEPSLNEYDLPNSAYVPWLNQTVQNSSGYGIYFQDRWDEALEADPSFIYLNDWNEWIAGKYNETTTFMGRSNPFYFVDQYNAEFNRTISPMKDGYTDNYYMQMAQNIRKYKGARPIPRCKGIKSITIDGSFSDWNMITPYFYDTKGDIVHRDFDGYAGLHYTNTSGRNDILYSKVAVDKDNIYFYVETSNTLSDYTGSNWMLLLIDSDKNPSTGWYGYDYLINKKVKNATTSTVMKYNSTTGTWDDVAEISYAKADKQIELAVPRKLLNLIGNSFVFDFKWADNPADLKDPISLCVNGDTAPNRRFNYRCIWSK